MTNKKTASFLRSYNKWRRGAKTRMPEPKEIGISIDRAIEIIERHDALLFMLRRWMPVIEAHVEASHLMDGFKRKPNEYDLMLELTKSEIGK